MSSKQADLNHLALVEKAIVMANGMYDLLESEHEKLKARDEVSIQSIALEKRSKLIELDSLGKQLQETSEESGNSSEQNAAYAESKEMLQSILLRCQQRNQDNQNIAAVELRHSRQALNLLRSLMNMNDLVLYGEAGEISVSREKRYLGNV